MPLILQLCLKYLRFTNTDEKSIFFFFIRKKMEWGGVGARIKLNILLSEGEDQDRHAGQSAGDRDCVQPPLIGGNQSGQGTKSSAW